MSDDDDDDDKSVLVVDDTVNGCQFNPFSRQIINSNCAVALAQLYIS